MFECPYCGAMPDSELGERLGKDADLLTRLGYGETKEELVEDLVAKGASRREARKRVRRVFELSALGGHEIRRQRQRHPVTYTRDRFDGVPWLWPLVWENVYVFAKPGMFRALAVIAVGAIVLLSVSSGHSRRGSGVGAILLVVGLSDLGYGLARHFRVITGDERVPIDMDASPQPTRDKIVSLLAILVAAALAVGLAWIAYAVLS